MMAFDYGHLRMMLGTLGSIVSFTSYRTAGRATVVFETDRSCYETYLRLHHVVIGNCLINVIPEEATHMEHLSASYLGLPPNTGAFIVSPPPSPPPEWAPGSESSPVQSLNLSMVALALDDISMRYDGSGRLTLLADAEGQGIPSIIVEDYDNVSCDYDMDSSSRKQRIPQTVRPPLSAGLHSPHSYSVGSQ